MADSKLCPILTQARAIRMSARPSHYVAPDIWSMSVDCLRFRCMAWDDGDCKLMRTTPPERNERAIHEPGSLGYDPLP